jgi:hypothetical protein
MKKLYAAKHAIEAHLIRGFLVSHGIDAVVRGDHLTTGWGELPVDICSVWVVDEAQFEQADALVSAFFKGSSQRMFSGGTWTCPRCGEELEGQFTACWSCGTSRQ